ncbi:MAG: DUF805 domain-containing protein [Pseudonocardia sp.]|nr:DUF805 domain-containing protein [Pseudonocardia sp.]
MNWYIAVLKNYVGFHGRARRLEFWMFTLINMVVIVVLYIIDLQLGTASFAESSGSGGWGFFGGLGLLSGLYSLAVFLPTFAVQIRRLHDTDRSGWWLLIGLIPFIGSLVLLIFFILDGTRGPNRFGEDPKTRQIMASP